jgi:hypothetical protein
MTSWPNDKLTKWQVDQMTSWPNDKLTKWQVDKITSWQNDKLTKWQVDKMTLTKLFVERLTKWHIAKMTSWKVNKMTSWPTTGGSIPFTHHDIFNFLVSTTLLIITTGSTCRVWTTPSARPRTWGSCTTSSCQSRFGTATNKGTSTHYTTSSKHRSGRSILP